MLRAEWSEPGTSRFLDRYVELELADARADEHLPGMRTHLEGCPACAEDHQTLLAFVAGERGSGL